MSRFITLVYNIATTPLTWLLTISGIYKKKATLLIIGLDNSGKTTLLGLMANNRIGCYEPTFHPNKEEIVVGNITFTVHDLGGHVAARKLWVNYYSFIDGILFMVDASDSYRIPEAKKELYKVIDISNNIPILIIGNKNDLPGAYSNKQLRYHLGIEYDDPNIGLFMCSVVKRSGIQNAFKWLVNKL